MATARKNDSNLDLTAGEMSAITESATKTVISITRLRSKAIDAGLNDNHGEPLRQAFITGLDLLKVMLEAEAASDTTALLIAERRLDQQVGKTVRAARKAIRSAAKADKD